MGEQNKYCVWMWHGSPMGPIAGGSYFSTQCGHQIMCKKPKKCDYCGKPVADSYLGSSETKELSES